MTRPTSIVHYWGGTPETVTSRYRWHRAIFQKCRERGWDAWLVLARMPANNEIRRDLEELGIRVVLLPRPRRSFDAGCMWRAYRVFSRTRCDLVHVHCVDTSPMIGAFFARVPVRIWTNHSASRYTIEGVRPQGIHALCPSLRVVARLSHLILPVSQRLRDELLEIGVPDARMVVAPVPVDTSAYGTQPDPELRSQLGIAGDAIVVATVGQCLHGKGWDVLIRAFAQVKKEHVPLHLVLIGALDETEEQRECFTRMGRLVAELGMEHFVSFLGHRKDVAELLAISDVFAFPSRGEGLPGALLEAMAAGLPCVATRIGGNVELIRHDENGILVDVDDVESLASSLVRLADDRDLAHRLGEAGRASLVRFSLDYQVEHIMRLYDEQLNRISRLRDRQG